MTNAKAKEIMERYQSGFVMMGREETKAAGDKRSPQDQRLQESHLHWMCNAVLLVIAIDGTRPDGEVTEKCSRWIGFVQGCLWAMGVYTIDELREHNISE